MEDTHHVEKRVRLGKKYIYMSHCEVLFAKEPNPPRKGPEELGPVHITGLIWRQELGLSSQPHHP